LFEQHVEQQRHPAAARHLGRHGCFLEHPQEHHGRDPVQVDLGGVGPQHGQQNLHPARGRNLAPLAAVVAQNRERVAARLDQLAVGQVLAHEAEHGGDGAGVAELAAVVRVAHDERRERVEDEGQQHCVGAVHFQHLLPR
jgi:hypothetical protein